MLTSVPLFLHTLRPVEGVPVCTVAEESSLSVLARVPKAGRRIVFHTLIHIYTGTGGISVKIVPPSTPNLPICFPAAFLQHQTDLDGPGIP